MVTKVRGSFNEFEGRGYLDTDDPIASRLELTIKAASIDTRNADRDGHLRGTGAEVAAGGCMLADLGPIGLLIGVLTTVVLFLWRRRRAGG